LQNEHWWPDDTADEMTMDDANVPAHSFSPREGKSDNEIAMCFEREALPLLDPLYRGALALTGDRLAAEDLLEKTMMNARRLFGSFPDGTNLRASLYRLLTNAHIGSLRAGHHRRSEGRNETTNDWQLATAGERPSTRLSLAEVEELEALPAAMIAEALQALRLDTRMVVYYADVEGLSYAEIAHITNRSASAVMSLLCRGRCRLRHVLLAACREQAACQSPEDLSNLARVRRSKRKSPKPKCAPLHRLSEDSTCTGQLDRFDREIVHYVLLWAPHGEGRDEDIYPTFGMTADQLVDRFHRIIDTSVPHLDRLAKSDRELLDKARQLSTIFGQPR
jgi:RNA polymerase sigma-70 factor, ECF subfamily